MLYMSWSRRWKGLVQTLSDNGLSFVVDVEEGNKANLIFGYMWYRFDVLMYWTQVVTFIGEVNFDSKGSICST